jgi:hypothetical protein
MIPGRCLGREFTYELIERLATRPAAEKTSPAENRDDTIPHVFTAKRSPRQLPDEGRPALVPHRTRIAKIELPATSLVTTSITPKRPARRKGTCSG